MAEKKKTLVMGASLNPARYSHLAINKLVKYGHPVIAFGKKPGLVGEVQIETKLKDWKDIDTITLYMNVDHQKEFHDFILSISPRRIIFNPGAENDELAELAKAQNITTLEACTLVMLSTGLY